MGRGGLFDPSAVARMVEEHVAGVRNHAKLLWALIVFEQWRAWCLRPEHFGPELAGEMRGSQFDAVRAPVLSWAFSDDPIATPAAVESLLKFYPHAQIERRCSTPREVGARRLGHQGFFFERHRDSLWRGVPDWLDARGT